MALSKIEDWDEFLVTSKNGYLDLNKMPLPLKPEKVAQTQLIGNEWHNTILRHVGSYVAKGLTDDDIHTLTMKSTLDGYTVEETRTEVQVMIDGARVKGFDPVNYHEKPLLELIANIELKPIQWLVDGLIEAKSTSQIFGVSGSGKSFIAIDLACCIASGKDFHGHSVVSGPVIFVAGEGRRGVVRRISAWAKQNSFNLSNMKLFVSRTSVGILNQSELKKLKTEINGISEKFGYPALIVLDTLARNFGNANENDTQDMSGFVKELERLNDEFNCATLIAHHSGHGESDRGRGSSVLYAALDQEYKISKTDDRIVMRNTKMKDEDAASPMHFYLVPFDLGKDENGVSINSAVLEYRDEEVKESARLTDGERLAFIAFNKAATELKKSPLDLNTSVLHLDQWREAYYSIATQDNAETKRKAFARARKTLQTKGRVKVEDDFYTLLDRDTGT